MILVPAIDLRGGKVVRLLRGDFAAETTYADNPALVAERFVEAGAPRLHVVDLDGARAGAPVNLRAIQAILRVAGSVPIEVGGGIRDEASAERLLLLGARYLILGTRAMTEPAFLRDLALAYPGRILVGLDAREGKLAVRGWEETTTRDLLSVARELSDSGAAGVIFTDISRDGTGLGPNLEATRAVAAAARLPVLASGGIGSLAHLREVCALQAEGVVGAVVGRALYEGTLALEEALALAGSAGQ